MTMVLARLSHDDFIRVQAMLLEYAGITLAISKRQMAENRLNRALRLTAFHSFDAYLTHVAKDATSRQFFVNAMTTNVTSFYREPHHFNVLRLSMVLPRVWSAGCSTGEEAISILFTILDTLDEGGRQALLAKGQPLVLATDVDTAVLNTAEIATYTSAQVASIPAVWLARAFEYTADARYVLRSEYKQLIKFHSLNLNAPSWSFPLGFTNPTFDAIFCRNVMIYFSAQVQRTLLLKFRRYMSDTSLFFSGHSEMLLHSTDLFDSIGATAYRPKPLPSLGGMR